MYKNTKKMDNSKPRSMFAISGSDIQELVRWGADTLVTLEDRVD